MTLHNKELLQELLAVDQAPCLSLYMPTHRKHPENLQDVILFKNLIKELKDSLLQKYSQDETQTYLVAFDALASDNHHWEHTSDGLAIFSAQNFFKVVKVHKSFEALAIVADSFHTKPLRQYMQSLDHYHVLGLSLHDFRIFEGNRHHLTQIELSADQPNTLTEILGEELTEKHSTVASYGGSGTGSSPMHHGHGNKSEESEKDAERYFRLVATMVQEQFSKPTGWPLVLAALSEHQNLFQSVNKNPALVKNGIVINPAGASHDQLAALAWDIMAPEYDLQLASWVSAFEQANANGKGSTDYKEVAVAAVEGRVETLLVEADRIIPVRITNLVTGNKQQKDLSNPKVDDLLDDMSELVLKMGGQVMVLPAEKMPTPNGLAAIFRYAL